MKNILRKGKIFSKEGLNFGYRDTVRKIKKIKKLGSSSTASGPPSSMSRSDVEEGP
jgi:hypothetical protein